MKAGIDSAMVACLLPTFRIRDGGAISNQLGLHCLVDQQVIDLAVLVAPCPEMGEGQTVPVKRLEPVQPGRFMTADHRKRLALGVIIEIAHHQQVMTGILSQESFGVASQDTGFFQAHRCLVDVWHRTF